MQPSRLKQHRQDARDTYTFKRRCIEKSLYGVDIDPGAVEIAKLRLWLSLVVDEEDIRRIKPLPNLDYKIVCGNSLLGVEKNLFNNELFAELERLKPLYFDETNPTKKQEYKRQIDSLISRITEGHKDFDFEVYFSEVFHEQDGFDVVIANPPYVQIQKFSNLEKKAWEKQNYKTYSKTGDIYCLFYEKGIILLKNHGVLAYITSNNWMRAGYGKRIRDYFATDVTVMKLIDFGDSPIFDNATTYTNIIVISKSKKEIKPQVWDLSHIYTGNESFETMLASHTCDSIFGEDSYVIIPKKNLLIKAKVHEIGQSLKKWNISIYRGILTGFNEAFVISDKKKDELIATDKKSAEIIKPILRGRDIKKYQAKFAHLWMITTFPALNLAIDDYSAICHYLKSFGNRLHQTGEEFIDKHGEKQRSRKKTGNKWFETQDQIAYHQEFEREKIMFAEIVFDSAFYYDTDQFYPEATAFILTGEHLKYLTAMLNSRLLTYAFKTFYAGGDLRGNTFRYKKAFLENLPVAKISKVSQSPFIEHVDRILAITKDDDYLQSPQKQAKVKALEREIDQMVYQLYGLTEEEIRIVESSS